MLRVFGQTDKTFVSNGDAVLRPLRAKVYKEDNGDFYLDIETGLEFAEWLVQGNIVVANTPQGDQAFRLSNPQKSKRKINVRAWHVFYDAENYVIADSYVVRSNCDTALRHLNSATEPVSEFDVSSDVSTINSFRCVRQSFYDAILTVLDRWGGHLVRDNFEISIKQSIGADNGVTVRYGNNLKDITAEENWDNVVTKLLPVGKDGTLLNAVRTSDSIWMISDVQYDIPYVKTVTFDQNHINPDDYDDETSYKQALVRDLRIQGRQYLDKNSLPQVNYTLSANLDAITDIGDVIEVIDERLGIDLMTNVIAYEYDCILERYTNIEFGNFKQSLSGLVSNINTTIDKTVEEKTDNLMTTINEEIDLTRSVATSVLRSPYTALSGTSYSKMPLTLQAVTGNKLEPTGDGGIRIGIGVTKVQISAQLSIDNAYESGNRHIRIVKNGFSAQNTLAWSWQTVEQGKPLTLEISPHVVDVREGDVLYLMYYSPILTDSVAGDTVGGRTAMTVQTMA